MKRHTEAAFRGFQGNKRIARDFHHGVGRQEADGCEVEVVENEVKLFQPLKLRSLVQVGDRLRANLKLGKQLQVWRCLAGQ